MSTTTEAESGSTEATTSVNEMTPLLQDEPVISNNCAQAILPGVSGAEVEIARTGKAGRMFPIVILYSIHMGIYVFVIPFYVEKWHYYPRGPYSNMTFALWAFQCLTSALTTRWWTALSDTHGRKPVLLLNIAGSILTDFAYVTIERFSGARWPILFFMAIFQGLFGGYVLFYALAHAYIAESTAPAQRLRTFYILHGVAVLFIAFAAELEAFLAWAGHYVDGSPFKASVGFLVIALFLTQYLLPESVASDSETSSPAQHTTFTTIFYFSSLPTSLQSHDVVICGLALMLSSVAFPFMLLKIAYNADANGSPPIPQYWYFIFPPAACVVGFIFLYPLVIKLAQGKIGTTREASVKLTLAIIQFNVWVDVVCCIIVVAVPWSWIVTRCVFASISFVPVGVYASLLTLASLSTDNESHFGLLFGMMAVIQDVVGCGSAWMVVIVLGYASERTLSKIISVIFTCFLLLSGVVVWRYRITV